MIGGFVTSVREAMAILLLSAAWPVAIPATAQEIEEPDETDLDQEVSPVVVPKIEPAGAQELRDALKRLSYSPNDVAAMVDAGNAALLLGDSDSALNYFTKADRIRPGDGRVKAGLGSALVRTENPFEALRLFDEAIRLGVSDRLIAADRGLAYDLLGNFQRAQQDYQLARTFGPAPDRLIIQQAVSLALSGRKAEADNMLVPLLQKENGDAWRARAFILAARGDQKDAMRVVESFMDPASGQKFGNYLRQMPQLTGAQQVAAIHFGHFPTGGDIGKDSSEVKRVAATVTPIGPAETRLTPTGKPLGSSPAIAAKQETKEQRKAREKTEALAKLKADKDAVLAKQKTEKAAAIAKQQAQWDLLTKPKTTPAVASNSRSVPVGTSGLPSVNTILKESAKSRENTDKSVVVASKEAVKTNIIKPVFTEAPRPVPVANVNIPTPQPVARVTPATTMVSAGSANPSSGPIETVTQSALSPSVDAQIPKPQIPIVSPPTVPATVPAPQNPLTSPNITTSSTVVATSGPGFEAQPAIVSVATQNNPVPTAAMPPAIIPTTVQVAPALNPATQANSEKPTIAVPMQEGPAIANAPAEALGPTSGVKVASSSPTVPAESAMAVPDVAKKKQTADSFDLDAVVGAIEIPESEQQRRVAAVDLKKIRRVEPKIELEKDNCAKPATGKIGKSSKCIEEHGKTGKNTKDDKKDSKVDKKTDDGSASRNWVQIATGGDIGGLGFDYQRIAKKYASLFKGYGGYTAAWGRTNRLVVGPFPDLKSAKKFENDLRKAGGDGFVWTSDKGTAVKSLRGK
jgi:Flp pilus assembly protein TadD